MQNTAHYIEDESTTTIPEEDILREYGYLDDDTDPKLVEFYREMIPKSGDFSSDMSRTDAVTTCAAVIEYCHELNAASKIIDRTHSRASFCAAEMSAGFSPEFRRLPSWTASSQSVQSSSNKTDNRFHQKLSSPTLSWRLMLCWVSVKRCFYSLKCF